MEKLPWKWSSIKKALKRYGRNNFSKQIVAMGNSMEEVSELERIYIKNYNAVQDPNFYNISDGGYNGNTSAGKTKEEIQIIRGKQSVSLKGKLKGEKNPMFGQKGYWYNKKLSKTHIQNAMKNKVIRKGSNHHGIRKVVLLNTLEIFDYIKEAGMKYNVAGGDISKCCKGKFKYIGLLDGVKLVWVYYEDYLDMSEEEIISKIHMSQNHHCNKKIICNTTKEIFESIKDASLKYNIDHSGIAKACRRINGSVGKHPITGEKLVWQYYDEYIKSNPIPLETAI